MRLDWLFLFHFAHDIVESLNQFPALNPLRTVALSSRAIRFESIKYEHVIGDRNGWWIAIWKNGLNERTLDDKTREISNRTPNGWVRSVCEYTHVREYIGDFASFVANYTFMCMDLTSK